MIREATFHDLTALAGLGARFWAEGNLPGRFDPDAWAENWRMLMRLGVGRILTRDTLDGAIGLIVSPDLNSTGKLAQESFWWVAPSARGEGMKLLREAERFAKRLGCNHLITAHLAGLNERLGRIYSRQGYKALETAYWKELS